MPRRFRFDSSAPTSYEVVPSSVAAPARVRSISLRVISVFIGSLNGLSRIYADVATTKHTKTKAEALLLATECESPKGDENGSKAGVTIVHGFLRCSFRVFRVFRG